jgi:hypothetical protein
MTSSLRLVLGTATSSARRNGNSGAAEPTVSAIRASVGEDGHFGAVCLNRGRSHEVPFALAWYPRKDMPDALPTVLE